ncbi:MAG: insulinase family protein [Gammaproteobacteria bacterium]|nr:MAG: insulinase family protein [Gammaproteobacteria bacterium]
MATIAMCLAVVTAEAKVHEFMLDNGMKVLVKPDRRAPVVVTQVWYKVGASYEHNGITGISHILEHMMFKGTPKVPAGEFSRIISANGGKENAFTGQDYTAYFQRLEKSRLEISFELEADRMRNAILPADEFLKERDVVAEERRLRTEDNPQSRAREQFRAAAFVSSPYHHSVIGWMSDIQNSSIEDARSWYERWYVPNNATLVVVGDVKPDDVLALAKKHFGPVKAGNVIPPKPRPEIEQTGERRSLIRIPAAIEYLMMGYKVPTLNTTTDDSEIYALEVLAWILDGGDSARISKELVREKQLAASTSVSYDLHARLQTLFGFAAVPAKGKSIEKLEKAIREQVRRVQDQLVSAEELDRVKTQILTDRIYQLDSGFYQAMQLGMLETVGIGWQADEAFDDGIRAVTSEQIQAVARKYLVDERLTVAVLDPLPIENNKPKKRNVSASSH